MKNYKFKQWGMYGLLFKHDFEHKIENLYIQVLLLHVCKKIIKAPATFKYLNWYFQHIHL
jgi:hypothetical protein